MACGYTTLDHIEILYFAIDYENHGVQLKKTLDDAPYFHCIHIDLEMLLGLLSITGSAEYLHLEELDEDEVSISLSFKSQKFSEVLPYGVQKDFECVLHLLFPLSF